MTRELLSIGDPLLPHVRRAASVDRDAHIWLLASARHWAIAEFTRRQKRRAAYGQQPPDDWDIEHRVRELRRHQVAVVVGWGVPSVDELVEDFDQMDIRVGFLRDDTYWNYVSLDSPQGRFAGVMEILDIVELPRELRVASWPTSYRQSAVVR